MNLLRKSANWRDMTERILREASPHRDLPVLEGAMRLQEELGLDSVRAFAVMVQLNQELGIPLDILAEAARDLSTVEDVLNLVATVRARGPVPS